MNDRNFRQELDRWLTTPPEDKPGYCEVYDCDGCGEAFPEDQITEDPDSDWQFYCDECLKKKKGGQAMNK
jgi:hypothetical protein